MPSGSYKTQISHFQVFFSSKSFSPASLWCSLYVSPLQCKDKMLFKSPEDMSVEIDHSAMYPCSILAISGGWAVSRELGIGHFHCLLQRWAKCKQYTKKAVKNITSKIAIFMPIFTSKVFEWLSLELWIYFTCSHRRFYQSTNYVTYYSYYLSYYCHYLFIFSTNLLFLLHYFSGPNIILFPPIYIFRQL